VCAVGTFVDTPDTLTAPARATTTPAGNTLSLSASSTSSSTSSSASSGNESLATSRGFGGLLKRARGILSASTSGSSATSSSTSNSGGGGGGSVHDEQYSDKTEARLNAQTADASVLLLKYLELRSIPPRVFAFSNVKILDLRGNKIELVSEQIARLTALRAIRLSNNTCRALPPALTSLAQLHELDVGRNKFARAGLPAWIGSMTSLTDLNVQWNDLGTYVHACACGSCATLVICVCAWSAYPRVPASCTSSSISTCRSIVSARCRPHSSASVRSHCSTRRTTLSWRCRDLCSR
jgi:Leucine-rich repeat (LRR) protein